MTTKELIKKYFGTLKEFCDKTGVNYSTASQWQRYDNPPNIFFAYMDLFEECNSLKAIVKTQNEIVLN